MDSYLFLVAILVISLINWLVKKLQEKQHQKHAEELRADFEAHEKAGKATGTMQPPAPARNQPPERQPAPKKQPQPQPAPKKQPQPAESEGEFREILNELLGIPKKRTPEPPSTAVELPRPPVVAAPGPKSKPPALTQAQKAAAEKFASHSTLSSRGSRIRASKPGVSKAVHGLIAQPGGLQQAIVLREILGPPQSLK